MTPQFNFMVLAPLRADAEAALSSVLSSMNASAGVADPNNGIVPFARFDRLHFARFVVLRAPEGDDISVYGLPRRDFPPSLAFLGDYDGPEEGFDGGFMKELVDAAGPGLRRIFAFCESFDADTDLVRWMEQHAAKPSARYVNWIGRTVREIREDDALRHALSTHWELVRAECGGLSPQQLSRRLLDFVDGERQSGRLQLTPPAATPGGWQLRNWAHLIGVPIALLLMTPFLIIASPLLALRLRSLEKTDPELAPRPGEPELRSKAALEDHDFTNQFSAFGDIKPGAFRRNTVMFLLWVLDYAARHVYNHGYLTRVQTIHFARWVLVDENRRMFFASNYDGSLDSYMDDFINKVAWGINLVFSNGVGFPRTKWLLVGGASYEQKYNRFLHRHQRPTAVWYKAYPGLSVADLNRNTRVRQGVDQPRMSDKEAREWLSLL